MLGGRGQSRRSPILPVLFSVFLGKQIETLQAGEITLSPLPFATRTPTDLDLLWSLYEVDGVLNGVLGYDSQLFDLDTVQELVRSYEGILSLALQYPEKSISEFRLTSLLEKKVREYHDRQRKNTVAISATFTSEPLTDTLHFWFEELGLNYHVQFAPYNQVFQQLLDETSLLARNQSGIDIILLRWEDWLRFTGDGTPMETLRKNLADLSLSLAAAVSRTAIPTFVCLCPSPLQECHPELDEEFVASLVSLEGVYPIVPADFSVYPVTERDDPRGDELGHIPYTPMFYTAIATVLARKVHALVRSPYKVVVVDGDNTLWKGVCGEDGVEGIQVSAPYRDLQTFLVEQQREGILLGLCSKNAEADVREVFARHPDMVLRWEHLAAWRVNWQSKSGNLKALARELRLSLDSFIFLDDNPVEIAEVTANCPEVLALLLPSDSGNISRFSRRVWAFDRLKVTGEDRQRSTFYRQNAQREQVRSTSMTLADFIEGLNLQITIAPMKPEQVARVAQLTRRTNQFNATGRQRDESEIQALYRSGSPRARVVEVSDRFGDYGLVGVIFYTPIEKIVQVDTFLLSCRTLGRGVEHRMLASIAERAKEAGCEWIDIPYRFTEKNQPVLDFLQSIDGAIGTTIEGGYNFRVPTALAIDIQYRSLPAELPPRSEVPPASPSGIRFQPGQIRRIVEELSDPEALWREIQCRYRRVEPLPKEFTEPRSELERELVGLWREFLPVERVGVRDNFFELGGDSILTIQLIARAYRIGLKFTPTQLFENPTIERLARVVTRLTPPATDDPERSEPLSLSPIQREFLAKNPIDPHRFHYSLLLETSPTVDPALLERAVRALITRHEILGCRFRQDLEGEWQISREESADENFWRTIDVSALSDGEREKVLETTLERLHEGLNLERGPLFSGSLFHYGRGAPRRLLLTAHRLVIDTASWAILLDDLATTYQQLEREEPPSPSPIETPYRVWVKRSNELPRMEKNDREVIADSKPALPVPIEVPEREEDETGIDVYQLSLDLQEVPLLSPEVHQAYNTRPEDVLLAAALSSFGRWTKKSRVRVDVEKSARENPPAGLDLSRTAGWLGDILPVEYPYTEIEGPEKFLKQVKELLRRLERGEKENPAPTERALCYFHYLGSGEPPTVTAPFTAIAREVRERDRSFTRFYGLKIEASLVAGRLEMNWIYDRHVHRRSPVEHLARDFIESLQSLVRHCIDREVGGYTPSDFPDANLTSEELTSLLSLLD
jgi:FkbH-like protein/non-ribosomal peptide synthase protein (TIGR01720 family)